jgi:hypothetical protein
MRALLLSALLLTGGCSFLQNNPEVVKTVLQLGLRIATYTLVAEKPGIEPHVKLVADVLSDPVGEISPESLGKRLGDVIESNVEDTIYKQSLNDISTTVLDFYSDVYEKHKGELSEKQFVQIMEAMGESMRSGLGPRAPASRATSIETRTTIIIID